MIFLTLLAAYDSSAGADRSLIAGIEQSTAFDVDVPAVTGEENPARHSASIQETDAGQILKAANFDTLNLGLKSSPAPGRGYYTPVISRTGGANHY